MAAKEGGLQSPTYLLLSAIITRPLHPRLMSWLIRCRTRQGAVVSIGCDQRRPLPLARRVTVSRRCARRRGLIRRLDGDAWSIEGSATCPAHRRNVPVVLHVALSFQAPVSGGTWLDANFGLLQRKADAPPASRVACCLCERFLGSHKLRRSVHAIRAEIGQYSSFNDGIGKKHDSARKATLGIKRPMLE
jgi:hypothetical protein